MCCQVCEPQRDLSYRALPSGALSSKPFCSNAVIKCRNRLAVMVLGAGPAMRNGYAPP